MNETQKKQVAMHKDFFDRCKTAIDHGFYMEAILLEYAAMESRLEIILGVLGLPCNKYLEPDLRRKTKISHRISCLEYMYKHSPVFVKSCMKTLHMLYLFPFLILLYLLQAYILH